MSAICGIFERDGAPAAPHALRTMTQAMAHHGHGGIHSWERDAVALGCLITPTLPEPTDETGPAVDAAAGIVVTADARLDNRDELCESLDLPATDRHTVPDSQLILAGYRRWGQDFWNRLEGSFTLALWDRREERLWCVTDPLCTKALYLYESERRVVFASELKGLLAFRDVAWEFDETGFAQLAFLTKSYRSPDLTWVKRVRLLPAATAVCVTRRDVLSRVYWTPTLPRPLESRPEGEYVERLRDAFTQSVRACLRSRWPIGAYLSGGLDSSAIACAGARLLRAQGQALTAISSVLPEGDAGPERDERPFIDIVAAQEGLRVLKVHPPLESVYQGLDRIADVAEHPRLSPYHYLYSAMQARGLAEGVRVILCGAHGELGPSSHGDGYLQGLAVSGRWGRLISILSEMSRVTGVSVGRLLVRHVIRPLAPDAVAPWIPPWRHQPSRSLAACSAFRTDFFDAAMADAGITPPRFFTRTRRAAPGERKKLFSHLRHARHPSSSSMFPGQVEVRYPFKNRRLIALCLSLPEDMWIRRGYGRYPLRACAEGLLPPQIQWRISKAPFSPDYMKRLRLSRPDAVRLVEDAEADSGVRDFAGHYLDLDKIKRHAREGSGAETWAKVGAFEPQWDIVQPGIHALAFLKWAQQRLKGGR